MEFISEKLKKANRKWPRERARKIACAGTLAALAALLLFAPSEAFCQQTSDPLERTVAVTVLSEKDNGVVEGIQLNQFRAEFRGKPVQILSADESPPHRVVLLLDTSGSMTGPMFLPALMMARQIIVSTSAETPLALLTFAATTGWQTPLTADRRVPEADLDRLESLEWDKRPPLGVRKTALYDAIGTALGFFGGPQPGDAIAVVTDGDDNASRAGWRSIRDRLRQCGVRFFVLLMSDLPESIQADALSNEDVITFSNLTGGDHIVTDLNNYTWLGRSWLERNREEVNYRLHRPTEAAGNITDAHIKALLEPVYSLATEVNEFYVLRIRLPREVDRPRGWKLEVVDPQTGKPDHHLIIHYPSQLSPLGNGGP